ncbi:GtrA family protein [Trebonia kvetii]|uniref:GtrA family protein n=1 Tax=Trebonia kvetii TaxID=2480626 RepID=A0A6P2C4D7_9ACTN|nr:GtrA family protein [Trebonia kvetii]TVZ05316.1 GtrA family protein [Trebonia kvetii]
MAEQVHANFRAVARGRTRYERLRQPVREFGKFAAVGIAGVFVTNGVYDLLYLHHAVGPVLSASVATIVAMVGTYLGNRYWSFRGRRRTNVAREISIFAVLNGIGLLIQDATVAFNYYLLGLGHDKLAVFCALNTGILLATLFRFWSYRLFVWGASPAATSGGGRARR